MIRDATLSGAPMANAYGRLDLKNGPTLLLLHGTK